MNLAQDKLMSLRNTRKKTKRTSMVTTKSRRNKFGALTSTQEESEETEVNSVEEVQEFVDVQAKSVWPFQKNGLVRSTLEERCQTGSCKWKFLSGGKRRKLGVRAGRQEVLHEVFGRRRWHPFALSWTEEAR